MLLHHCAQPCTSGAVPHLLACSAAGRPASCGSSRRASVPGPPSLVLVRRLVPLPALSKRTPPRYLAFARYPQRLYTVTGLCALPAAPPRPKCSCEQARNEWPKLSDQEACRSCRSHSLRPAFVWSDVTCRSRQNGRQGFERFSCRSRADLASSFVVFLEK